MSDEKHINANLLRRMMLGDFSAFSSDSEDIKKQTKKKTNVIDLHFSKLYSTKNHLSSAEKLKLQLSALEEFLEDLRRKGKRNCYIIYGKGDGVLKREVSRTLKQQNLKHNVVADPPYFGNAFKSEV